MASDQYRMHRVRQGDEWVLGTLSRGNARFGEGDDSEWLPPLSTEEAARFVADPRTICVVAIDQKSNHIAGFVYGGVLNRRHTKLEHVCLYEVGVDIDHRAYGVGTLLLQAFAAEARSMGIDRGFVITAASNKEQIALYQSFGAVQSPDTDLLFGLNF